MSIFKTKKRKKNNEIVNAMNELIKQFSTFGGGDLGSTNKRALNKIFGRSAWYKALVSKRGRDIARIPLFLIDKNSEMSEIIKEHELLDMFKKFNNDMVGMQARKLLQEYFDNIGEWIIWISRNVAGVPVALYPLNPADVIVRGSDDEKWQINFLTGMQEIDNKDIIYCRDINPDLPYGRGIGQGQAASDELAVSEKVMKLLGLTFDNKAIPPFIINFKGVGDTEVQKASDSWLSKMKGITNIAKPMFTNADIGVQKLGMNFEETKIIELRQGEKELFREMWGIPAELMGNLGTSNRASSINAWNIYAENVLIPNMDLFIQCMQCGLVDPYNEKNGTNYQLGYKSPNKADETFMLEVAKAFPMNFTANEIRELAHHEEWLNGKGDEIWVPLNFTNHVTANRDNIDNKPNLTEKSKVIRKFLKLKKKL